jgi:hypothetical protein
MNVLYTKSQKAQMYQSYQMKPLGLKIYAMISIVYGSPVAGWPNNWAAIVG